MKIGRISLFLLKLKSDRKVKNKAIKNKVT